MAEAEPGLSCVILGSFQFKDEMDSTACMLREMGVTVLAPKQGEVVEVINGVKVLVGDNTEHGVKSLEAAFISQFRFADFLYTVAKGGYIGTSTAREMYGNIVAYGRPMFSSELISNPNPKVSKNHMRAVYRHVVPMGLPSAIDYVKHAKIAGYPLGNTPALPDSDHGLSLLADPWILAEMVVNGELELLQNPGSI